MGAKAVRERNRTLCNDSLSLSLFSLTPTHTSHTLHVLPLTPARARPRVQSLKGVAGDLIILEEAAYCDPGLISEVGMCYTNEALASLM